MRFAPKSVSALALVLVLSACGGGADQAGEPAATDTAAVEAIPAATAPAAAEATPAATPSPTPTDAAATPTPAPTPTPTTAAAAPAAAEPAAFAVCKACHSMEPGKHGIGPSLAGIWGEPAAAVPGFEFSEAMQDSGLTWDQAALDKYLADPRGVVPGTKMAFGGVKDAAKRQQIIDYIKAN